MDTIVNTLEEALSDFVAFLPALVAGLIVLLIGWVVAAVLRRVIMALLPRTHFDRFLSRHRIIDRDPQMHTGSRVVASAAFWAIVLIALMQASNIWGLGFVANGLGQVIAFVPNVVAAVLVFGLALLIGNWLRDRMRARETEERRQSTFLPDGIRALILTVGAFLALRQLRIAPEILVIGFALVFGAIALATAIAFGLGGRHTVERMTHDWYERQRAERSSRPAEREAPGGRIDVTPGTPHA